MAFKYKLEKFLQIRVRRKEEQLQVVLKVQRELEHAIMLVQQNKQEIASTRENMRKSDHRLIESYDRFLKHLYEKEEELLYSQRRIEAKLKLEKLTLQEREQEVNVLEKHKENMREEYLKEEKDKELKNLSEVALQKYFIKQRDLKAEENEV